MEEIGASLQGGGSSHRESLVEAQDSVPNNIELEHSEETLTSTQYLELTHAIDKLEALSKHQVQMISELEAAKGKLEG